MSEFEIEKHVPVKQRLIYPFKQMEENDSFFVKFGDKDPEKLRQSVASSIYRTQRLYGGKFTMRTSRKEGGIRVWCTAPCDDGEVMNDL